MTSTVWENIHKSSPLIVSSDIKPWAGYSSTGVLSNVRAESVTINPGATLDTATLAYTDKEFGDEVPYFLPIKIQGLSGEGDDAELITIFRGFITKQTGELSAESEKLTIECQDYKWYLGKRSNINGRWYAVEGATDAPAALGTGLSIGATKYVYEKFRANIQDDGGFLQNQPCVFNKDGRPDCFTSNYLSAMCVFFYPNVNWNQDSNGEDVAWDESKGLKSSTWAARDWAGKYWTWGSILSYIEKYWIEPYNALLTSVEFHRGDLYKIATLDVNEPIDFSIEGMNVITAIDTVVKNLPGRWYWYLDYSLPQVRIRVREYEEFSDGQVFLKVGDQDKLANNGANVVSCNVTNDGSLGAKFAKILGRSIRLTSTVKLVPMWKRYWDSASGSYCDFEDATDFKKWRDYIAKKFFSTKNNDKLELEYTKEERARYDAVYRAYGVPMEGELLGKNIVSADDEEDIILPNTVNAEYSAYETNLRNMFFKKVRKIRDIAPPDFARFGKDYVFFMWDAEYSFDVLKKDGTKVSVKTKSLSALSDETTAKLYATNRLRWIVPFEDGIKYNFDDKSGVIVFDEPQFMREGRADTGESKKDKGGEARNTLTKFNFDGSSGKKKMRSREVYLTASFATDVSALIGRDVENTILDKYSGAPFTTLLDNSSQDIVIHKNAWYPVTVQNKTEDTISYSTKKVNGHTVGETLRRCDEFDNYSEIIGEGLEELLRTIQSFIKGYERLETNVTATLPYLETGYRIGDKLKKIHNTKYMNLNVMLSSINWSCVDDSDFYETGLTFTNYYAKDKDHKGVVSSTNSDNEKAVDDREAFNYPARNVVTREA